MKKIIKFLIDSTIIVVLMISCKKEKDASLITPPLPPPPTSEVTVFSGIGDITAKVNAFQSAIEGPDNGAIPVLMPNGKRRINFDGVPNTFSDNNPFPGNFFNTSSPRGLVLSSFSGFRVSSKNFSDINPGFATQYAPFSPVRTIAVIGGSVFTAVTFKVPGKDSAAFVHAFGVVFCDVDDSTKTTMEFFDGNTSLGKFNVPAHGNGSGSGSSNDKGLSLLAVKFATKKITSVKIATGNANVDSKQESGDIDLVAMDDFIYSEPIKQQ